jgi:hypothetical protein
MKKAAIIFITLSLITSTSCSIRNITYNRDKILKKYNRYDIFLNSEKINPDTVYLDRRNIQSVRLDKKQLSINIFQKNRDVEYLSFPDICVDSTGIPCKIIIVDGIVATDKTKVETTGVKDIIVLKPDTLSPVFYHPDPVLLYSKVIDLRNCD